MLENTVQQEKKDIIEGNENVNIPKSENLTNDSVVNGKEEKAKNDNDSILESTQTFTQTDNIEYPEPKIGSKEILVGAKVVNGASANDDGSVSKAVENKIQVKSPLNDDAEVKHVEKINVVAKTDSSVNEFDAILPYPREVEDAVNNAGWTDVVSPEPPIETRKRICFSYRDIGHCKYGVKCKFSHNYPRKDCWRYETHGYCQYEKYCRYRHVADAIRDPWQGKEPSRYRRRPAPERYGLPPTRSPGGYEDRAPKRRLHETEKFCFQFSNEGWCRYGSGCRFRHIAKPAETSEFELGLYERESAPRGADRYVGYSGASSAGGFQPYTTHSYTSALGPAGYNTASPGLPVSNDSSHNISPSDYNYLTYEPSYYIYQ